MRRVYPHIILRNTILCEVIPLKKGESQTIELGINPHLSELKLSIIALYCFTIF